MDAAMQLRPASEIPRSMWMLGALSEREGNPFSHHGRTCEHRKVVWQVAKK